MSKKGIILAALCLLMMFPFSEAMAEYDNSWDFSSGLDPTMFTVDQTVDQGFTFNDKNGNLSFSKNLDIGQNPGQISVVSQFKLQGNFDIKVEYNLTSTSYLGNIIFFGIGDQSNSCSLERNNTIQSNNEDDCYQVYLNNGSPSVTVPTSATTGTLEIVRTGSVLSFWVNGSNILSDLSFDNSKVKLWMGVTQGGPTDYGSPFTCSFDNLSVQANSITNPAPLPGAVWLLGSGLLGLVGLRRFRKS